MMNKMTQADKIIQTFDVELTDLQRQVRSRCLVFRKPPCHEKTSINSSWEIVDSKCGK